MLITLRIKYRQVLKHYLQGRSSITGKNNKTKQDSAIQDKQYSGGGHILKQVGNVYILSLPLGFLF